MDKATVKSLSSLGNSELEQVLMKGDCPKLESLVGWEFNGYNTPFYTQILGIKKFKKGFIKDPQKDAKELLLGYNVKTEQNRFDDSWIEKRKGKQPIRFGWYHVYPAKKDTTHNKYQNALLINYGCDRNAAVDPTRLLRDYLVQVDSTNENLLLGKAYFALPLSNLFVSYFILERSNEVSSDEVLGVN